jgi:hypothetical protein
MIEINLWIIIGTIATVLGLLVSLIASIYKNKIMKESLMSLSELIDLERIKDERERYRAEIEKREYEARERWRKNNFGLKILDFIVSNLKDEEEIDYDDEMEE